MRLVVTGGGTGGGVYPALSVVEELLSEPRWDTRLEQVTWVGKPGGIEERVAAQRGIRFQGLSSGPLRGANLVTAVRSLAKTSRGVMEGRRLLDRLGADVVLATGGYVSAPLLAAAWGKCPSLVYLPDMKPGLAVRYLSPLATRIAVSFEEVAARFAADKVFVSGYPVRRGLYTMDRHTAREQLALAQDRRVVLVMGGSTGARAINKVIAQGLQDLLRAAQLVHLCGEGDYGVLSEERMRLPSDMRESYHLYAYLDEEMPAALTAADLVVARAGASTLGEFPAAGLAAILVPYPYSGQHQRANAEFLVSRGAALLVEESEAARDLVPMVITLLNDDAKRERMALASRALARPDAARRIASELAILAESRG